MGSILIEIIKSKNSGSTARKNRGNVLNSIDPQSIEIQRTNLLEYDPYLKELVDEKFQQVIDDALNGKFVIQAKIVCKDYLKLSDLWIIRVYFLSSFLAIK